MPACIIVGSGPGISKSIAERFGRGGFTIGLVSRSVTNLKALTQQLSTDGVTAFWEQADAGNPEQLKTAIQALINTLGRCDVLIYNAAVLNPANPLELTSEQLITEFSVNVLGAHVATKHVVPDMVSRNKGAIVFKGGGLALEPFPEWTSLALGKAALKNMAISLYKELAPHGIHVSVIAICGIVTEGGPFDPALVANEYWRVATEPRGVKDREIIYQPIGTDPLYNDPEHLHKETTILPGHVR
ncbi:SDR family NAD(P)-dependent oxidoreductase [Desulfosediminicola flagellatus]|uniref:SDR family NAD(P)-dependent oxidoreductase n=1 Tax=Desulfosediminicola flagellatus TaxID=2569541 RepID=UPI0010AC44D5|nr:SDR family oxidoreductase [Desulfosediminicola flagellatus]